jgi:hypothetical protein
MNVEAVRSIVDAGVPVANNQVQFSLLDRRPLNGMIDYCMANGIKAGVIWGSDESTTEDQVVVHMVVAAWWQTAGCSWSGGGGNNTSSNPPTAESFCRYFLFEQVRMRRARQSASSCNVEVCSAQLVSLCLPQPCAGPTSTLTKHYDSRPSTHGPHSVGCRCGCDTVAVKALWATSDTHGVATPALCCCVLQLFTYGSVGGGLLSDKYVELEPQKGLFGGYNSVCC